MTKYRKTFEKSLDKADVLGNKIGGFLSMIGIKIGAILLTGFCILIFGGALLVVKILKGGK